MRHNTQQNARNEKWKGQNWGEVDGGRGTSGSVTVNGTKRNESQEMSQNTKNNKRFAGGTTSSLQPPTCTVKRVLRTKMTIHQVLQQFA